MPSLIRRMRKKEMKNAKYLKYALGEIFLVVVGILIALSINNWNEGLKKSKKEEITIAILSGEIEENVSSLKEDFLSNNVILDSLTLYLKGELGKSDSFKKAQFISYVLNYSWGKQQYPTLEQELGPNRVIQNDTSLSASLKALKDTHIAVNFQLNYLNELFNTQTVPYLLKAGAGTGLVSTMFQYGNEAPKLSGLYDTEALKNILSIQQLFLLSYNNRMRNLIVQSEETLKLLKQF